MPTYLCSSEQQRLEETSNPALPWRKWGPYLSERQWGTVREDYSASGTAWDYFPHEQARSRAYHWGEDGLAGISDDKQRLCFAVALWNGVDPILKERLFGLTNSEGNHGEDVKEYYFYLDNTPTHSYMKYLYKYPQRAFPYDDLVQTNRQRSRLDPEYELLDTGIFNDNRTSTSSSNMPNGIRKTFSFRSPCTIADPTRRCCTCFLRCGFETPGHGGRATKSPRSNSRHQPQACRKSPPITRK